ncbi:MAG TPA: DHHA2 domain-containing protein [Candidatus Dojkabacteria bacterium]|nr:DHHA2 domain-containing protein [Candidatus Dojkabacteria bacterium]
MKTHVENILIGDTIYISGHKKPDLDAIVSAYTYQIYRHARGDFNYVAIRCDDVNPLTEWVFKHFNIELPMLMKNVEGRKIVLVDHTDPAQRPEGWEKAEIVEVLDHHNLKLETTVPAKITIRPYGSSSTLVAQKMLRSDSKIQPEIAGLLLAAILDDTLALRSPITTYIDKIIAGELAGVAGLSDINKFARELFDHKDIWDKLNANKIITTDMKSFDNAKCSLVISQVETMDREKLANKEKDIVKELEKINKTEEKDIRMVMITDILRNDCVILAVGKKVSDLEKIFETKLENGHRVYLPGVTSRKKDVVPPMLEYYK